MRDLQHIQLILASIEEAWLLHPNYRLGQLLVNASGVSDIFHMEDEVMEIHLKDISSRGASLKE